MTVDQNDLVRKQVSLGVVRALPVPTEYIGLSAFAPKRAIQSDDYIFSLLPDDVGGLAPARAEDAEAEIAFKDDYIGEGKGSIIDWAIKDTYDTSDITRHRSLLAAASDLRNNQVLNRTVSSITEGFQERLDRDTRIRRLKLDTRAEWLIMKSVFDGKISYNDGKIAFEVDWERPADQHQQAPDSVAEYTEANKADADPIGDIKKIKKLMKKRYGVNITQAWTSEEVMNRFIYSDRFIALGGILSGTGMAPTDPNYTIPNWGPQAARAVIQAQTGVTFNVYDGFYWDRPLGSKTRSQIRFTDERDILFMPDRSVFSQMSDIGFGQMLTSPHIAGNMTPDFYTWEKDHGQDPWRVDYGTGIKMFPVFPHMDHTYTMRALTTVE